MLVYDENVILLLPRDESKVMIQLTIILLVVGSLLLWLGFLAGSGV
jgi:hypothetical protein